MPIHRSVCFGNSGGIIPNNYPYQPVLPHLNITIYYRAMNLLIPYDGYACTWFIHMEDLCLASQEAIHQVSFNI